MRPRTAAILSILGVLAVAGGWYFGTAQIPSEQTVIPRGTLMFPGLEPKLAKAAKLEIIHHQHTTVIEKRSDGGWGVASVHDYPALESRLRGVFTGLVELRLAERRTADPAQYNRLGVGDPNAPSSTADLVKVLDAAGNPIVSLIVGNRRVGLGPDVPDQVYVRLPGQKQSWLADGSLNIEASPALWLDRNVMNIGHDRIVSVKVGDGLTFGHIAGRFALVAPADHPKLEAYKVDDVNRALELLTFETVKADSDLPDPATEHAVFQTNDGLAIKVGVFHAGGKVWARFTAIPSSDRAVPEADKLNTRMAGWTYEIGSWKEKSLVPTLDDLKAPPPKPAKTPASPAAQPPSAAGKQ